MDISTTIARKPIELVYQRYRELINENDNILCISVGFNDCFFNLTSNGVSDNKISYASLACFDLLIPKMVETWNKIASMSEKELRWTKKPIKS